MAIDDFEKSLLIDPRLVSSYIYGGICKMKEGEYNEALGDFERALQIKPDNPIAYNNIAWLYIMSKDEKLQDKGKALDYAIKAAALTKETNADILDTLAMAYFINNKVKKAVQTEQKALALYPDNRDFRNNLLRYKKALEQW